MFGGKIRKLTITGEIGNFALPDVKCNHFQSDVCFDALAKVLLGPRGYNLKGNIFSLDPQDDEGVNSVTSVAHEMETDELTFVIIDRRDKTEVLLDKSGDAIKAEGFVEDTRTSKFMMSFCSGKEVRVYNKVDEHKTIVLATDVSSHQWHVMLSGLPAFLPWCFEGENKLEKNEVALIMTLVDPEKSKDDFITAIEQLTLQFDLQTEAKKLYLNGFEDRAIKQQVMVLKEQSSRLASDIANMMQALQDSYTAHSADSPSPQGHAWRK